MRRQLCEETAPPQGSLSSLRAHRTLSLLFCLFALVFETRPLYIHIVQADWNSQGSPSLQSSCFSLQSPGPTRVMHHAHSLSYRWTVWPNAVGQLWLMEWGLCLCKAWVPWLPGGFPSARASVPPLLGICSTFCMFKRISPRQAAGVIDAVGRSFSKSLASDPSSPGLWQWRQRFLARLLGGGAGARAGMC